MAIQPVTFDGLDAVEITTSTAQLLAVTSLGPRIAFLGRPGGENLFYWQNDTLGRGEWRLLGGHRVWATRPGADESEGDYAADNDPCTVETYPDRVRITGGVHPFLQTARGLEVQVVDDTTFRA